MLLRTNVGENLTVLPSAVYDAPQHVDFGVANATRRTPNSRGDALSVAIIGSSIVTSQVPSDQLQKVYSKVQNFHCGGDAM
jgi:hypothetical protein